MMNQKMKVVSRLALVLVILLTSLLVAAVQPQPAQAVGRNELQRALMGTVRVAVALDGKNGYSTGSGTVVSDKGYVVTNFHVVGDTKTGRFYNSQRVAALAINQANLRGMPNWTYTARVVQADPNLDVAILKVVGLVDNEKAALPANLGLTVVPIGNSDDVQIGDEVSVLGFPGIGGDTVTFTQGRISGFLDENTDGESEWFKTDAEVNHGNSGGLAINDAGEMVGIPTAGVSDREDIGKISLIRPVKLVLPLIQAALKDVGGSSNGVAPAPAAGPQRHATQPRNPFRRRGHQRLCHV
jgi:S1-C subfamily serine protease